MYGRALVEQGELDVGMTELRKALAVAGDATSVWRSDIEEALRGAAGLQWRAESEEHAIEEEQVFKAYNDGIEALRSKARHESDKWGLSQLDSLKAIGERVKTRWVAARQKKSKDVPEAMCCPLTYCPFVDPVVTPSGHSYERDALVLHIKSNGPWDPLTREKYGPTAAEALVSQSGLHSYAILTFLC